MDGNGQWRREAVGVLERLGRHRRLVLGLYLVGLLAATLSPSPPEPSFLPAGSDKVVHLGMFGGLAALVAWNLHPPRAALRAVGWAIAVAALLELLQGPMPTRVPDLWDLVFGAVGAALSGALVAWSGAGRR